MMASVRETALRTARSLRDLGHSLEMILAGPLIPAEFHEFVRSELEKDENFPLAPVGLIAGRQERQDWFQTLDRSTWHYWPALRQYLLTTKGWSTAAVRSLDDASDKILQQMARPGNEAFDIRGLVLGFVQSGKTANFTAVIAKAADAGYRLVIVLSGIDKGLRRQTNIRLKRELVGYSDGRPGSVRLPPIGRQWHEFTRDELEGDFQPGLANHAALQGSQPVLLVVKKNGPVLRRLLRWIDDAPPDVRRVLPLLVIDDEADLASVDTRGSYQTEDDPPDPDYEPPSIINGLIRDLLRRFQKRAYIAYTATPFANILIPHDTADPRVGNDLYPKDFIANLPKPAGYFGAEEFFGRMDSGSTGKALVGLDVVREVPDSDLVGLANRSLPASLETALADFVLAAAARAQRMGIDAPATMLIHTSQRVLAQSALRELVGNRFADLRDEWRYQRKHGIRERLEGRWEEDFRRVIAARHSERDVTFTEIEPLVGAIFEAVIVREINSFTGEVLDYEKEPSLKAIAIGGNRLSRGLTLEGLLVSYFVRPSATYDTLMQMGRWFGFREGYEDLTRIWTTAELADWFSDLAFVEHRLREDLDVYESQGLTPHQVGMRIWQHPSMQITSPLKRRFASNTVISQSYAMSLEQTFKFPVRRPDDLAVQSEANRIAVRDFVAHLGAPNAALSDEKGPVWTAIEARRVLEFLGRFRVDDSARSLSLALIGAYIERLRTTGELVRWTVGVRGLKVPNRRLGVADWGLPTGPVSQISRSRLGETESLGVIVDPEDEALGLATDLRGTGARSARPPEEGLLLLYPISRYSGVDIEVGGNRRAIFDDPTAPSARDIVGLALSFPPSRQPQQVEAYLEGSVGWRPIE